MGRISRVSLIVGLILFPALVFAKFHNNTTSPYSHNGLGGLQSRNTIKKIATEQTFVDSIIFLFEFETIDRNLANILYQSVPKTFFLDTTAPVLTDLNKFAFNKEWMTNLFSIQNDINRITYREDSKYGKTHIYINNQHINNSGISFGAALPIYCTNSILKNKTRCKFV